MDFNLLFVRVFCLLVLSSCSYEKKLAKWCERCPKETTKEIIERIDTTTIVTPADSAWYFALLECIKDSNGKFVPVVVDSAKSNGRKTRASVNLSNGKLKVDCKTLEDSLQVLIKQVQTKEVVTKIVPKIIPLKWWQKFLMWCGGILLVYIAIRITWFIAKNTPQLKPILR